MEEASRSKLPGYELLVKGALLRFLALLIAQGKQYFICVSDNLNKSITLSRSQEP